MELQSEIVAHALDIISRPMWWGLSMEVGSKLPFSSAYFPYEHHLLRILAGPISQEYFQHLVQKISGSVSHTGGDLHKSSAKTATNISLVDHKSMWAMVMNFPCWFFFASTMLFCNSNNIAVGSLCSEYTKDDLERTCPSEAAKFIAWILYPTSESTQLLMVDYLDAVSDLRLKKCSSLSTFREVTTVDTEATRPKLSVKNRLASHELDSHSVALWLKEYRDMHVKLFREKVGLSTSNTKGFSIHQSLMFRRIPLGILLLHPSRLSKEACSVLLLYASTGTVEDISSIQNPKQSRKRLKRDSLKLSIGEAIAGCRSVFEITDVAESISQSMFTEEEEGLNFVCEVKTKTCSYLLQCVKRLVEMEVNEGRLQMRRDLLTRLIQWRRQGKDVLRNNEDLDFVCDALDV